jgi:uncharacterized integral membrane protein
MQKFKWTSIALATGLLTIILLQNTQPVETRVLFMSFIMPRAALLFITALLGFLCGVGLTLMVIRKGRPGSQKSSRSH